MNAIGEETGNAQMCEGRDLPWLQDVFTVAAWNLWDVTFRDVVILNGNNEKVGVYNLTEHDLMDPANYAELKGMLKAFAHE